MTKKRGTDIEPKNTTVPFKGNYSFTEYVSKSFIDVQSILLRECLLAQDALYQRVITIKDQLKI